MACLLQIDRIRYVLSSYLRVRLEKIERYAHHLLEKDASASDPSEAILSPQEASYAKELVSVMNCKMPASNIASFYDSYHEHALFVHLSQNPALFHMNLSGLPRHKICALSLSQIIYLPIFALDTNLLLAMATSLIENI